MNTDLQKYEKLGLPPRPTTGLDKLVFDLGNFRPTSVCAEAGESNLYVRHELAIKRTPHYVGDTNQLAQIDYDCDCTIKSVSVMMTDDISPFIELPWDVYNKLCAAIEERACELAKESDKRK
ncbi:MAG TPA: hypothetical protein VIH30_04245 [Aquirhabdus sp.]